MQHIVPLLPDRNRLFCGSQFLLQPLIVGVGDNAVDRIAFERIALILCQRNISGDGTFLTTASLVGHLDIPILGINCGHLGYLAEVQTEHIDAVLDQLITNNYTIEQRRMLEVTCQQDGKIASPYALNEVAILKSGLSSMITVDVTLNGEFLHKYKADG